MHRPAVALLVLLSPAVHHLAAQEVSGTPGPRLLLPRNREIALARSAAPPSVASEARVWVFAAGTYVVADSGTSVVQCRVGRGWPQALEPHCFDEEGARTIMPIEMRKDELLHRGVSTDSVEREIAAGIASGRFRLPQRPAVSWMLSSAQVLYDDDGARVGAWKPHIMIYYPYLTAQAVGTGANQDLAAGIVVSPGSPMSNIMIVVPKAVDPAPDTSGAARSSRR
jgi:hypothetical protein